MGSRGIAEESESEIGGKGIESDPGSVMAGSSGHQASPAGHAFCQTDAGFNGESVADVLFLFGIQRLVAPGLETGADGNELEDLIIAAGRKAAVA